MFGRLCLACMGICHDSCSCSHMGTWEPWQAWFACSVTTICCAKYRLAFLFWLYMSHDNQSHHNICCCCRDATAAEIHQALLCLQGAIGTDWRGQLHVLLAFPAFPALFAGDQIHDHWVPLAFMLLVTGKGTAITCSVGMQVHCQLSACWPLCCLACFAVFHSQDTMLQQWQDHCNICCVLPAQLMLHCISPSLYY